MPKSSASPASFRTSPRIPSSAPVAGKSSTPSFSMGQREAASRSPAVPGAGAPPRSSCGSAAIPVLDAGRRCWRNNPFAVRENSTTGSGFAFVDRVPAFGNQTAPPGPVAERGGSGTPGGDGFSLFLAVRVTGKRGRGRCLETGGRALAARKGRAPGAIRPRGGGSEPFLPARSDRVWPAGQPGRVAGQTGSDRYRAAGGTPESGRDVGNPFALHGRWNSAMIGRTPGT